MRKIVRKILLFPVGAMGLLALEITGIMAEISPLVLSLPVLLPLYFLPALVAIRRKKARTGALITLNLLVGWFLVYWIVMLGWALEQPKTPALTTSPRLKSPNS